MLESQRGQDRVEFRVERRFLDISLNEGHVFVVVVISQIGNAFLGNIESNILFERHF